MVILDASVAPQLTDRLVVGASELAIINVVPIDPAGVAVAYKLQIRGTVDTTADGSSFSGTQPTRTMDGGDFGSDGSSNQAAPLNVDGGGF